MKVHVINLDKRPEKAARFEADVGSIPGLAMERFAAFDGAELGGGGNHPRLTPGQLGCFASHAALWERCVDGGWPWIWISEDDAAFPQAGRATYAADVAALLERLPEGTWDIVFLSRQEDYFNTYKTMGVKYGMPDLEKTYAGMATLKPRCGLHMYVMSARGCRRCLEACRVPVAPVDVQIWNVPGGLAAHEAPERLRASEVRAYSDTSTRALGEHARRHVAPSFVRGGSREEAVMLEAVQKARRLSGVEGESSRALAWYEKAVGLPNAWFYEELEAFLRRKFPDRLEKRLECFLNAIELSGDDAATSRAYQGLFRLFAQDFTPLEACRPWLRRAVRERPRDAAVLNEASRLYESCDDRAAATECLLAALRVLPDSPALLYNVGLNILYSDRPEDGVAFIERALSVEPNFLEARLTLATYHDRMLSLERAEKHASDALAIAPETPRALIVRGSVRTQMLDLSRAEKDLRMAVSLAKDQETRSRAENELATCLKHQKRFEEAEELLRKESGTLHRRFLLGSLLLLLGRHEEGYPSYNNCDEVKARLVSELLKLGKREWTGRQALGPDATLLCHAVGGLGDAIMFLRYIPIVLERVPGKVLIALDASLRSHWIGTTVLGDHPRVEIVEDFDERVWRRCDFFQHTTGLPAALGMCAPAWLPLARTLLSSKIDSNVIVINWHGNAKNPMERHRRVPLAALVPLFERLAGTGTRWVSVQKEPPTAEERRIMDEYHIEEVRDDPERPFARTMRAMSGARAVVSSDTAVAHLAGTMGLDLRLLLAAVPEWRWGVSGRRTAWYPSATLYRQAEMNGDWTAAVASLAEDLASAAPAAAPANNASGYDRMTLAWNSGNFGVARDACFRLLLEASSAQEKRELLKHANMLDVRNFSEGFQSAFFNYSKILNEDLFASSFPRSARCVPWDGLRPRPRPPVVFSMQGLGDCVMAARFLPLLHERLGSRAPIAFVPAPRIACLFEEASFVLDGTVRIENGIAPQEQGEIVDPMCALGLAMLSLDDLENAGGTPVDYLARRSPANADGRGKERVVVFSWKTTKEGETGKSMPLEAFVRHARMRSSDATWVCTQAEDTITQAEMALLKSLPNVRLSPDVRGFDRTIAIFRDDSHAASVVSIDTALVHVAIAHGVPVEILFLPRGGCWRWGKNGWPWYPKRLLERVVRQRTWGSWDEVEDC